MFGFNLRTHEKRSVDIKPRMPVRQDSNPKLKVDKHVTFNLDKNKIYLIESRRQPEHLMYIRGTGVRLHAPRDKPSFLRSIF